MIFSPSIECADREEIQRIQLQGLISTVKRVYEKVPYYKEKLDAAGVKPEDIVDSKSLRKSLNVIHDSFRS